MVKKLEDYEWICPEPFTNLKTSPVGTMMPCCVTDYEHYGPDIKSMDLCYVQNTSLKDYHKSDFVALIKKALKENNKDILKQTCYTCIKQEECGQRSHRQYYLSKFEGGDKCAKSDQLQTVEISGILMHFDYNNILYNC